MRINVDTDQIIPTLFLGGTDAKGYGTHLFHHWRFLPDGSPNPEFILNQPPYDRAQILLADRNFGCGSSRERAPKALREFGYPRRDRAVLRRHLLQQLLPQRHRAGRAAHRGRAQHRCRGRGLERAGQVTVDLETQTVTSPSGHELYVRGARHAAPDVAAWEWTRSRSRSRGAKRSIAFAPPIASVVPGHISKHNKPSVGGGRLE